MDGWRRPVAFRDAGAPNIERVDRLVQSVAAQRGMRSADVDEIVKLVDGWLVKNRRKG